MADILEQLYDFDGFGITASDRYHLRMMAGKEIERLRGALKSIAEIENQEFGSDWDEIDAAREIARDALKPPK